MNTAEKFYLPVDGILEMFNPLAGLHQSPHAALTPVLRHPKVSDISKTGMGIIKSLQERWRQQGKRTAVRRTASSSGRRQEASDRLPKGPMDLLELGATTRPRNSRRIVVLGAPRVGKTNILQRFLGGEFQDHYVPTTEDFHRKLFHIGGEAYQVDLLDASSERDFPAKRRLSILTGDIFLLVFSLDDKDSLREVGELLNEIRDAKAKLLKLKNPARAPAVVCGNKADLAPQQRVVSRSEVGETVGDEVSFFETSAKDGAGLDGAFRALAALGGLPDETCPSRHQIVPVQSLCLGRRGGRGARRSRAQGAPLAAVDPAASRPSFTSDLRLVLGSSTKHKKPEKCPIQ